MADRLDDRLITERLRALPHWMRVGDEIRREVTAASFLEGIGLVTEVARAAEDADHHPDIDIRYRTVSFALTTHSAGGLTSRDFDLAEVIDALAARHDGG